MNEDVAQPIAGLRLCDHRGDGPGDVHESASLGLNEDSVLMHEEPLSRLECPREPIQNSSDEHSNAAFDEPVR